MSFCEHIVIGSGPGGASTAAILAENGKDVLILEEGDNLSLKSCKPFSPEEMLTKYRSGGLTPAIGKSVISYVEGAVVGGGSEVNSGLYHRLPKNILSDWTKYNKLENFNLEKHYEQVEKDIFVSNMPITPPLNSLKLLEGSKILGWSCKEIPRWFQYSKDLTNDSQKCDLGIKKSMSETLIPRAIKAGAKLVGNAKVLKIQKSENNWKVFVLENNKKTHYVCKYLFVCCGAIYSPFLLKKSGIKVDSSNFSMHPSIKITAKFDEDVSSAETPVAVHQVKEFSPKLSFGCSVSTKPYLALSLLDYSEELKEFNDNWTKYASYYAMITPQGRGNILKYPFLSDPVVKYSLKNEDYRNLKDGLKKLALILLEAGAKKLFFSIKDTPVITNKSDLDKIDQYFRPKKLNLMTIHLMSSLPMGEAEHCSLDSWGKVKGYDGLYVNDGSCLGGPCSVNPQGTIMALAYRNVEKFLSLN